MLRYKMRTPMKWRWALGIPKMNDLGVLYGGITKNH